MRKLACFKVYQHEAFKKEVIEHQVDIEIVEFRANILLACHKSITFAYFEQEVLQISNTSSRQKAKGVALTEVRPPSLAK